MDQRLAEDLQLLTEEIRPFSIAGHPRRVVVAGTDDHIVRMFGQDFVALVHGRAEVLRRAVIGHAVAVPAEVAVFHVVLGRQLVMPGLLDGADVVLDIAVTEDDQRLAIQRSIADVLRSLESGIGHAVEALLRLRGERQCQGGRYE